MLIAKVNGVSEGRHALRKTILTTDVDLVWHGVIVSADVKCNLPHRIASFFVMVCGIKTALQPEPEGQYISCYYYYYYYV